MECHKTIILVAPKRIFTLWLRHSNQVGKGCLIHTHKTKIRVISNSVLWLFSLRTLNRPKLPISMKLQDPLEPRKAPDVDCSTPPKVYEASTMLGVTFHSNQHQT